MAETDNVSIVWPDGDHASIRAPVDFKHNVDQLLEEIKSLTDLDLSRNDFLIRAAWFYYRHLSSAQSAEELKKKLET